MKVFLSWSGEASRASALALQQAIGEVFNGAVPWISSEDIKLGQSWFAELMDALQDTRFAIVCLTRRNAASPWVMFESGAVSAHFGGQLKVVPLLLEGDLKDLVDPLARFNGTAFHQAGMLRLFESINDSLGKPLTKKAVGAAFGAVWPELETAVRQALRREPPIDVFLSVPMAAFGSDAQYQPFRAEAMKVVQALRQQCGLTVFCALEKIESIAQFDTYGVGAREDVEALQSSAHFVMIYPERLVSSALFEAGYALARGLPCRFFVRQASDLPFLMRKLPEVFSHVSIVDHSEWQTCDDVALRLQQNAQAWFGAHHRARLED